MSSVGEQRPEGTCKTRATKFVVVPCGADGSFKLFIKISLTKRHAHTTTIGNISTYEDVKRACMMRCFPNVIFPWPDFLARDQKIRDPESNKSHFR